MASLERLAGFYRLTGGEAKSSEWMEMLKDFGQEMKHRSPAEQTSRQN